MKRPSFPAGCAEKSEYKIASAKIPKAFDGFKIAHISDLHSKPARGVPEIISAETPDITVITGDLFNDDKKSADEVKYLIRELLKISPVFFISGNHDEWRENKDEEFRELEKLGAKHLENEMLTLNRESEQIALFGIDDPMSKKPTEISENLNKNLLQLPDFSGYKILLFHRANLFDEIKNLGYDLILSGHMHGGQIIIPHLGGLLAPSSALFSKRRMIFPKYCFGKEKWQDTTMLINRGLSNTLPVPRWGNKPEVGIIKLICK